MKTNIFNAAIILLAFLPVAPAWTSSYLRADEEGANEETDNDEIVLEKLEKLGGRARTINGFIEIDFHLRGQELTDRDLEVLSRVKKLRWLHLGGTKITSEGLRHLKGQDDLESLHLEGTAVDDKAAQYLIQLPSLSYLNLYDTQLSDQGLVTLAKCEQLKNLYVWKTSVTRDGVKLLKSKLPDLKISTGVDLESLAEDFPMPQEEKLPTRQLQWNRVESRASAPSRSDNGINCQVWFKNESETPVRLYWIAYGNGELKLYATLKPGEIRQQNTYAKNVWLITDLENQPQGYFVADEENALAVVPR